MIDRADIIPPHNSELEVSVIAAIFADNAAYDRVSGILTPAHFYEPVLGRIYEACGKRIDHGKRATAALLRDGFDADPALEQVGGGDFLHAIQDAVITVGQAKEYAECIVELAQRRQLLDMGLRIVDEVQGFDIDGDVGASIAAAEQRLYEISGESTAGAPVRASDAAWNALGRITAAHRAKAEGKVVGIPTGITPLDERIGGLHRSALYVVAGGTAQGKSVLAGTIADSVAAAGFGVLFVSLEMPEEQVMKRSYARLTGVPVTAMDRGTVTTSDLKAIADAGIAISKWRLHVLDKGDTSLTELRGHCRRLGMTRPLDLVIVDYLQLMQPPAGTRFEGRTQEVAKISRGLKALAMEIDCPVVALSQLSREVDRRDEKRPRLSDLRESGTIEQDADVVIFVYREEEYLRKSRPANDADDAKLANWRSAMERVKGTAELIVAKQRNGPTGECNVGFDGGRMLFTSEPAGERMSEQEQRTLEGLV